MKKSVALAIAGALTALVLVLMFGVGTTIAVQSFLVTRTSPPPQIPMDSTAAQSNISTDTIATKFTAEQAGQIALGATPNAKLAATPELVNFQGTVAYQVTLSNAVVYIDANTGIVLYNSSNANSIINTSSQQRSGEHSGSHEEEDDD